MNYHVGENGPEMFIPAEQMKTNLSTRNIMRGQILTVRVSKMHAVRTRLAIWLIRAAGAVLTVPVEIEVGAKGE